MPGGVANRGRSWLVGAPGSVWSVWSSPVPVGVGGRLGALTGVGVDLGCRLEVLTDPSFESILNSKPSEEC